ncbi:MAG: PDZ domain-containing protein, partial [Planctomycetota bacterium]|nr:PDZ domain-containing protein [Planctomycetota bacterium]
GSAEPFAAWLAELGPASGLTLDVSLSGQGVGGSDHQTFLKRKIPAVHFFSGLHPDYHKPSDDAERFEAEGAAKVARLVLELTRRVTDAPKLAWVEPPAPAAAQPGQARAGGFRVWFGSVPEYSFEGKGVLLAGTSPGSPAEKAGMLAGDVLVQVGDIAIESMQDFMYALQTYKPGDVVLARFQRDGKTEEVRLTLTTREAQ